MRSAARKWTVSEKIGLQIGSQLVKGVICRFNLTQVVEGYTSPHDHDAARRGIEWMREHR
jgi:hypothetical protein